MGDRACLRHGDVVRRRAQKREAAMRYAAAGDEDAVEHRQSAEQLADLIGPAQSAPDPFLNRKSGDVLAEEANPPRRRRKISCHGIEQRRLAGAVRAENSPPLAGVNPEVDVGERDKRPKLTPDARQLQRMNAVGGKTFSGFVACHGGISRGAYLQSGLSRLALPSLRKSASGMPKVWLTLCTTLMTLL